MDRILVDVEDPKLLKYKRALERSKQPVESAPTARPDSGTQLDSQSNPSEEVGVLVYTKRKRRDDDEYILPALGGVEGVGSAMASTSATGLARYTHVEFPEFPAVDDGELDANAPAKKIRPRRTSAKGKERATSVTNSLSPSAREGSVADSLSSSTSEGKEMARDRYTPISEVS
ncbi:hypothetical protein EIP86_010595 [Pleurotus ostreatoroseus]|nr:hypothetical protein EIP86_010595 [Pleurotus ostreatoroseus]